MKTYITIVRTGLLAGLLVSATAFAQSDPAEVEVGERRERMMRLVETVRIAKLSEALDLDPATAEKLFPVLRPFNERRVVAARSRMQALASLKRLTEEESADPKEVLRHLDDLAAAQREIAKVQDEEYEALKKVLDPLTLARYYRFQVEFEREVKGILRDFKAEKLKRRGGRP